MFGFNTNPVQAQSQDVMLVMGDSLSAAYGMSTEQGWVALLQQKLNKQTQDKLFNINVVNASLSGETTSGGLQRLPNLIKRHQPSYVILELGANDALRGQNLSTTEHNLASMIEISQQAGAKVLLLGIRLPTNYGPAYDARLAQTYLSLAETYQLDLDPFFLEDVALDPDLMQNDALHPNPKAQPIILQRLWPKLTRLILSQD
ncbi:arylesterase [Thiomicrospira pelophila]|uniref:arylesterase n=1 Tax=Thiomicrospira pelophila TaxID=934 RepID=UPI0004A704B2|nr:arylesterase [Thiomicrospira pelophila]